MNRSYLVFRVLFTLILLSTSARPETQGQTRHLIRALPEKYKHPSSYHYDFMTVTHLQAGLLPSRRNAVNAVGQWAFKPALFDGKAVSAAKVLAFNFVPPAGYLVPSNCTPGEGQSQKVEDPYAAGLEQFRRGQYERAVEFLSQVSDGDRDYTNAKYYLGVSSSKLRHYPEAAAAFRQLIDRDPTNLFAHYELAKASFTFDKKTTEQEQHFLSEKSPDLLLYLNEYTGASVPGAGSEALPIGDPIYVPGRDGVSKPKILYKEPAGYTDIARQNCVQGSVVLTVIFTKDGQITGIRVTRALPDGLTYQAIDAARKIGFQPATKDGQPVNVRANLEFTFNLY